MNLLKTFFGFAMENKAALAFVVGGEILKTVGAEIFKQKIVEKKAELENKSKESDEQKDNE